MKYALTAEVYSHGVRLSGYDRDLFNKLSHFLERLVLKEPRKLPRGGMVMEIRKKYYGMTEDHREIFIHKNTYPELLVYLADKGVDPTRINRIDIPVPVAAKAVYSVLPHYTPFDYQEVIIDTSASDMYSTRVDLQTGKGKTFCALSAAAKRGQKTVIMLPPKYFGIWIKALKETYSDIEGRYCTVSGSAELQMVIDRGIDNDLPWDILIISSVTYRAYIEAYERLGENIKNVGYNCAPPRFHEALGIGLQINDEIQEDPGLVFRTDIFTNVSKQIYLSATPYTGNAFVTKMIDEMLPAETSCELPSYDAYIDAVRLLYSDPTVQSTDYLTPYKNTYNHARYETQMLKKKQRTAAYFNMVKRVTKGLFVNDRIPGQRMLILCATVQFIEKLTKYLQGEFPELVIGQHVSGSDFRKLQTNDITVSTIKSAGTGQDILDLREVLLLQATDSKKDNIQILGRLRKLKNFKGVVPRLTYMACQNIAHHVRYARNKEEHFTGKVNSHRTMRL